MKIYFDNSATTPICEAVLEKYCSVSRATFGNPSSLHKEGFAAERELNNARAEVLASVADKQSSVIFTASGSEANNLAIIGRALSKERYLKGAQIRLERARLSPAADLKKDALFAEQWLRYRKALDAIRQSNNPNNLNNQTLSEIRWMLEEYRVSLFAQELHTPEPISPKRLDAKWATCEDS